MAAEKVKSRDLGQLPHGNVAASGRPSKVEIRCLGCDQKFKSKDPKLIKICPNCKKLERWRHGTP